MLQHRPSCLPVTEPSPASLRSHLGRPKNARLLYEELCVRARGPVAAVVRRHGLTPQGTCSCCGQPGAEGEVLCPVLTGIAHDLGLHLRLSTAA